jgi:hypothetical protein
VASSPDEAGAGQHRQMASCPASKTGRCNDSEPAYERLSRRDHQLEPDGSRLGCGAHLHEQETSWPVNVAGWEAMVKVCGVAVAKPQGHSWAPTLSNGLGGRESRLHGEGPQHVRSIHADRGDRW